MRRTPGILIALGAVLALLTVGTATAAGTPPRKAEADSPTTVAIAIGQLEEQDGDSATLDLRAATRDGKTGGTLRFYSPTEGYYNGGVRTLAVENGAIKASGGGGLIRPDGTRLLVRYTAEISADGQQVKILVRGRKGLEYTLAGRLDPGFVWAGAPPIRSAAPAESPN
ncbi:MAG: hypothetical protein HYY04_05130 [Chloroflexi bacterium]|nr:hypothetical protein [Chloroflexota bacterium]